MQFRRSLLVLASFMMWAAAYCLTLATHNLPSTNVTFASQRTLTPAALSGSVIPFSAFALSNNSLIPFNLTTPTTPGTAIPVTGLGAGENLVGIDFRPQNGMLYGLTSNGAGAVRLYCISYRTGVAVPLTATPVQFDDGTNPVPIVGTVFGMDFNPTVDRVRVVTNGGFNFRMNPNNGTLVDGNTGTPGVNPDQAINGGATVVDETAYTNNAPNVTATTQYTLDSVLNTLFIQNPPNNGTQTLGLTVTLNGATLDFTPGVGFDIPPGVNVTTSNTPATGLAFAALRVGGVTGVYAIELSTGAATFCGILGAGTQTIQGFSIQGEAVAGGVPAVALNDAGTSLIRFNTATPGTTTTVAVTGVAAGEVLVGVDFRPATGQLFGLGVNDPSNNASIYVIDPQTGSATLAVTGTTGAIAYVGADGTTPVDLPAASVGYGFDFNPTVDRIRVSAGTGLNCRVNQTTGVAVDGDLGGAAGSVPGVNPDGNAVPAGGTGISGDAYTNSFAGTTVTTLYTLDATTDSLFIQNPPNAGTQTLPLPLGVNFTSVSGFDIPSGVRVTASNAPVSVGRGFAALNVGGLNNLYSINLVTGAATSLGAIGTGTTNLAGLALADSPGRPALTAAAAATRQQGSAGSTSTLATVSDFETLAGNLIVTTTSVPAGLTVSSVTNTNGTITATITASCTATVGANTVGLQVTDSDGQVAVANFTVNVTANTPPVQGTYPSLNVVAGNLVTVTPSATPTDNGTVATLTVAASTGYAGTLTVNSVTGVVSANPSNNGTFTITVTATDNCGATSTSSFTLSTLPFGKGPSVTGISPTVGPIGTSVTISGFNFLNVSSVTFNGTRASFTVDSSTQITATVPFGATTGPVTVSSTAGSSTGPTFTVIRTK